MSNIVREDRDALNAVLTVTVATADYQPKFEQELQKFRKKAQLKGFRAGKTPLGVIKKMYGRALLSDVVNHQLEHQLNEYLTTEKIDLLGQPIPTQDHPPLEFDPKAPEDYVFKFDIGLAPEFEVKGLAASNEFSIYEVIIPDEQVDEELRNLQRRAGEQTDAVEVATGDIISLYAEEMADGQVKPEGIANEFSLFVDNAVPALREQLLGKIVGDQLTANIFEIEEGSEEPFVRKYLLNLSEDDTRTFEPVFNLTIRQIRRLQLPALDQAFFDATFGEGQATSEAEARDLIRQSMRANFQQPADALLFRDMQERLMADNPLPLPDDFLKRWLLISNENNSPATIEQGYPNFAKNLQWTLIRNKLVAQHQLVVEEDEIRQAFAQQVIGYFGGGALPEWFSPDMIEGMVNRMMQSEKDVNSKYDDLLTDKLHDAIKSQVTVKPRPIELEAFKAVLEEARQQAREADSDLMVDYEEEE